MATLNAIFSFTGRLGNIIAYSRNGRHFLRTRPEQVRQTAGTRRAAQWFGAASRKGALIRSAILPDLDIHCGGGLVNRLNSTIVKAGPNNHAGLQSFRFNPFADTGMFFSQPPVFSPEEGKLHIPEQIFPTLRGATRMEVKVIATRIDFSNRRVAGTDASVADIDLEQPFPGADLFVDVPGKGTLMVTLQIRLFEGETACCNRKYKAAEILAVIDTPAKAKAAVETPPARKPHRSLPLRTFPIVPAANGQPVHQRE